VGKRLRIPVLIHCLATLDLKTGAEHPWTCLIIQNC